MSSDTPPHDSHGPDLYSGRDLQSGRVPAVGRYRLRQVLFGGVVVIGLRFIIEFILVVGNIAASVGQASSGYEGLYALQVLIGLVSAVFFVVGAGLTGLFIAPLTAELGMKPLLGRLAIAGAIGTALTIVFSLLVALATTQPNYLLMGLVYSGLINPLVDGITATALFALGVLVARSLPSAPARGAAVPDSVG